MANQHTAQHSTSASASAKTEHKLDLTKVQAVVSLTPEQYETASKADAPPRPQLEMGGSGTAKASFKDAAGGDVKIDSSAWTSTGDVKVEADEKDPTSAKLTPVAPGPATITVTATTATGSAQAVTDLIVIDKIGAPVSGTIEITVQAPTKAKA